MNKFSPYSHWTFPHELLLLRFTFELFPDYGLTDLSLAVYFENSKHY